MLRKALLIIVLIVLGLLVACGGGEPAVEEAPVEEPETAAVEEEATAPEEADEPEEAADSAAPAEEETTLTIAITTFPNALDLPIAAERQASITAWHLYSALVWVDDDGRIVPDLAESWEISDDGSEYTFHLREGVTFHNGEPFTADSVVYSWERGRQPEMQWSDKWTVADAVEKIDDFTVKITTAGGEPNPLFLRIVYDNWAMVPPQYLEEVGEEGFAEHPVGTGPYQFVEWAKGDRIIFEAFPNYWQEAVPKIDRVVIRPIPESSTRVAAIQTGEVDIVTRLSAEEAASLEGTPGVEVIKYPVDRVYYITFNNLTTGLDQPTMDPLVRQAMNYAVDVQAIIDALFNGNGRQSTGYVTPANWGFDTTIEPFGYDPDKARELLAEAGYADGFEMGFACPAGAYTNFEQVCEAIQGYLAEVGIVTDLEIMESGAYWDLEANKELPPLFGDSWSEATGEALPRLHGALGGWDASFSAWSDPEIDRLLDEISITVDDDARADLYVELQRYMQENPPFIYLYEPFTFEAISTRVQNYNPRPAENYFLHNMTVSD